MGFNIKIIILISISFTIINNCIAQDFETSFKNPPMNVRPYVWWHWMGSDFSLNGITKDLEAMKDAGIGGATIFNITSAVQESNAPTENNPWPWQTYRSTYYWKAIEWACKEAHRLGLTLGLHNTVGYSTTGGPWIDETKGMKHLVTRKKVVEGGKKINIQIEQPDLPLYEDWGSTHLNPTLYNDIAILAVPSKGTSEQYIYELVSDDKGNIVWKAPVGKWIIYRIGYASTMSTPHPVPDDLIGKTLEVNKFSVQFNQYHWDQVINPVKQYVGQYFGNTFKYMLIDSYEAGEQNWSDNFQDIFMKLKHYNPVKMLPYLFLDKKDEANVDHMLIKRFKYDFDDVVAQLYQQNSWNIAKKNLHTNGLLLQHEPYWGPFSTVAGAASADLPMGEFWTNGSGSIPPEVSAGARAANKTIIGAEAFTSPPQDSKWTEDPEFLKKSTEGAFAYGVNQLNFHQWVHQPFSDKYQPGMSMGWWGTHFNRYQPWIKLSKAYFNYIGRAQYLLQQGEQVIDFLFLDTTTDHNTDAISIPDFLTQEVKVENEEIVLESGRHYKVFEVSHTDEMLPEVLQKVKVLLEQRAIIVANQPIKSPSLRGYPNCDKLVKNQATEIWNKYAGKNLFASRDEAIKIKNFKPDYKVFKGNAHLVHRHTKDADIYYIGNLTDQPQYIKVSLRIHGKLPEIWNAENGDIKAADYWRFEGERTVVTINLLPYQSRFIVMRKNATSADIMAGHLQKPTYKLNGRMTLSAPWSIHFDPKLDTPFDVQMNLVDFNSCSDERIKYFAGTAVYTQDLNLNSKQLTGVDIIYMNLGEMNDIASVMINNEQVDTLWYKPYKTDVTRFLRKGKNTIMITVAVNWANRMIGDEQYLADFEWGCDRGDQGRAMKGYPNWFLEKQPRIQPKRKAFEIWYYYRKDSPLQNAGLAGPVQLEFYRK